MAEHNQRGKKGEQLALEFLQRKGYAILATNYRFQRAEIDLIARDGNELVMVEVKLRSSSQYGHPSEMVSERQQKQMIHAAEGYLIENEIDLDTRFDIIGIEWSNGNLEIEHIKEAFTP